MTKYDVRVRYAFEGTYTVVAEDRDEAERMVTEDCGLVLGGNIHTTLDNDDVDWNFGCHPDMQILSFRERGRKPGFAAMDFNDRIEELRNDIIEAIQQLLCVHGLTELTFTNQDEDPVWVIWFNNNGDPYECKVTGIRMCGDSLTVIATDKESDNEVECYGPFELGAKNIDWLNEMYEAAKLELEGTKNNS